MLYTLKGVQGKKEHKELLFTPEDFKFLRPTGYPIKGSFFREVIPWL